MFHDLATLLRASMLLYNLIIPYMYTYIHIHDSSNRNKELRFMGLPWSHCTFHMEIPAALCLVAVPVRTSAGLAGKKVMIIWEGTAGDPRSTEAAAVSLPS